MLGRPLGPFWLPLAVLWGPFGRLGAPVGSLWATLGYLEAVFWILLKIGRYTQARAWAMGPAESGAAVAPPAEYTGYTGYTTTCN